MPSNKSPVPDGFSVEFYNAAWPVIGHDFIIAIQSFFIKGFLAKGINTTVLTLIPKKAEAKRMKDYWSISCYNVLYKLFQRYLRVD